MDATSSAAVVNNIILNLNFRVVLNLAFYAFAVTGGATLASKVVILLVQEMRDVLHKKWLVRFQDKRNLALEIIKICTEGSVTGWNIRPRDLEHIYYIARLLEGENEEASKLFDACISRWTLNATRQEHTPATKENIEFSRGLQKEAQKASIELVKMVNKWK